MCGINAVYSKDALHKSINIAIEQRHRGMLGTGVAYICNDKIKILKEPIDPISFYNKYKLTLPNHYEIAICHNRMPSQGNVSIENTHPFYSCNKDFAFIHNGNADIDGVDKILRFYGHYIQGQTDSEVLCHILEVYYWNYFDWFKALEQFARDFLGGAIIILTKNGIIYGVRNNMIPLNFVQTNKGLYLASEVEAIENVVESYNEKVIEKFSLEPYKPIMIHNYRYIYYGKKQEIREERVIYYYPYRFPHGYQNIHHTHRKTKHKDEYDYYDDEWLKWVWDYP